MPDCLLTDRRGAVLVATLNRPAKRNALSCELLIALRDLVRSMLADAAVEAMVITGAPPAFSSGLDLAEIATAHGDQPAGNAFADATYDALDAIYRSPKPIIAAVNGVSAAGGAGLMTVCDVAVAARSAQIGYPEIKRGLTAAIVMPFLIRQVGERRAKWLLLSGEMIDADHALSIGLIDEVVGDAAVVDHAVALARQLASLPPSSYADTKRILHEILSLPAGADLEHCRAVHSQMLISGHGQRFLKQFLEKR
ncbi:MAG: enoyl-CoA hydratase/isomerase family protein [Phycisphaerales bacterium]|nr:enoyl-CoA hydratase/isomerase family protein [Phycisphaerales bacterium]